MRASLTVVLVVAALVTCLGWIAFITITAHPANVSPKQPVSENSAYEGADDETRFKPSESSTIALPPPILSNDDNSASELDEAVDLGPRITPEDLPVSGQTELVDLGPRITPEEPPVDDASTFTDLGARISPGDPLPFDSAGETVDLGERITVEGSTIYSDSAGPSVDIGLRIDAGTAQQL